MEIETIIAIVTSAFALITSVATFSYNMLQNRKNRIQKVILENRIKYMDEMRDGFTDFIGFANAGTITAARNSNEAMKAFADKLPKGYGKIKAYIKPFYTIDKALLDALDNAYRYIWDMINGKADDVEKLNELIESFTDKYLKYDWAYWKYIQGQKDGNYMNSDDAFDNVYNEFVKSIEKK